MTDFSRFFGIPDELQPNFPHVGLFGNAGKVKPSHALGTLICLAGLLQIICLAGLLLRSLTRSA